MTRLNRLGALAFGVVLILGSNGYAQGPISPACHFHWVYGAGDDFSYFRMIDSGCSQKDTAFIVSWNQMQKGMRDFWETGSKTVSAEWSPPDHPGVVCGVTPNDAYITVHNNIGSTRFDEPTTKDWDSMGCEASNPRHQPELLRKQEAAEQQEAAQRMADQNARERAEDAEPKWLTCRTQWFLDHRGMQEYDEFGDELHQQEVVATCGRDPLDVLTEAVVNKFRAMAR